MKPLTPIKSIRAKCLECAGGRPSVVRKCDSEDCPLHSYRFGKNPNRAKIGPQQRSSDYNTNNNYRYNPTPQTYSQPSYQYNQPNSYVGQTQTVYANGQAYQVTPQSDGSYIAKDSYGKTYRIEGDK